MTGVRSLIASSRAVLPKTLGGLLVLLLVTMLVALLVVQAILFRHRFDERYAQEVSANMELARAVGAGVEAFVHDVLASEAVLGSVLTQPTRLTPQEAHRVLAATRAEYPSAREVSWASPQGRIVASSDPAVVGLEVTRRDYFHLIAGGRDRAVSDLFPAHAGADPRFVIARAARAEGGELRGVVLTAVDPHLLGFQTLDVERTGHASLMLFDRRGRLVYRRPELTLPWHRRQLGAARPLVARARAGAEVTGTFVSSLDGRKQVAAFVPLRDLGWVVGASRPTREITGPLLQGLLEDQVTALGVTAFALVLAMGLARAVAGPVRALETHAVAVAGGGRGPPPAIDRPVEIARLGRAFGHMVDETRARERELERRTEEAQRAVAELEAVFTAMAEGVVTYGPRGEIVRANPAAAAALPYTEAERALPASERPVCYPLERPDGTPIPPDETPVARALGGEVVRGVIMIVRLPAGGVWVSASGAPLRTPGGRLIGAVLTLTDITRLHELQEQHEDVLRAVSHDLRTPLSVIQLQAQRLRRALRQDTQPSERQAAASIETAAQRMGTMINELVESARREAGQLKLDLRPLDVGGAVRDLLARSGGALDLARLRVDVPPLPPVRADRAAFERIIGNLVSNALKYSPPGSPVAIGASRRGSELVIAVCDHGPGIADEDRQRLFHRFARAGGEAGRKEGLGLGLYITSRLVTAMGGRIWVESAPGNGSNFAFTLPVADPDAPG